MFAFSYCDKLALICYEGTQEEWKAVKLGDSNFGAGIGVELETIEIRFSTGWGPSLTLPAGLRRIESEAFAGIKNASFRVPATVEYIAPDAFDPSVTLRVPADSAAEEAAKGLEVTLVREK